MTRSLPRASDSGGELPPCSSRWRLLYDLAWAQALVWFASCGRPVSPTPGVHLYFADRYSRLAAAYAEHGQFDRARQCASRAESHWQAAGPDPRGPLPPAAAVAMPIPHAPVFVDARAQAIAAFS